MRLLQFKACFEPRDAWVGLFWNRHRFAAREYLDVYVCPVPFFVLHWRLWTPTPQVSA